MNRLPGLNQITAALVSVPNEISVALASLNFDFSLIEAPSEYNGVGSALTHQRRNAAEYGSTHITARKLGALFELAIPSTPNILRAYGERASDIANSPLDKKNEPTGSGLFSDYLGPDVTSIWAAATSGRSAICVHLLACLLARVWSPAEATSIWDEIVKARKAELAEVAQGDTFQASAVLASQVELSRSQLAEWDNSARAWLQFADRARETEQTKVKLVVDDLKLTFNAKADLYKSILEAWTLALRGMEDLVCGISQATASAPVMLALSSWHLYPDISVLGRAPIFQNDPLFPRGTTITLNLEGHPEKSAAGIYWSLSLSQMRYYGGPVRTERSFAIESSRLSFDQLLQVALGSLSHSWGPDGTDPVAVAQTLRLLSLKLAASPEYSQRAHSVPIWWQMLGTAATAFLESSGSSRTLNRRLFMLGRTRGKSMLAEPSNHPLALFGLVSIKTFLASINNQEYRVKILTKYAQRFFHAADAFDVIIRYRWNKEPPKESLNSKEYSTAQGGRFSPASWFPSPWHGESPHIEEYIEEIKRAQAPADIVIDTSFPEPDNEMEQDSPGLSFSSRDSLGSSEDPGPTDEPSLMLEHAVSTGLQEMPSRSTKRANSVDAIQPPESKRIKSDLPANDAETAITDWVDNGEAQHEQAADRENVDSPTSYQSDSEMDSTPSGDDDGAQHEKAADGENVDSPTSYQPDGEMDTVPSEDDDMDPYSIPGLAINLTQPSAEQDMVGVINDLGRERPAMVGMFQFATVLPVAAEVGSEAARRFCWANRNGFGPADFDELVADTHFMIRDLPSYLMGDAGWDFTVYNFFEATTMGKIANTSTYRIFEGDHNTGAIFVKAEVLDKYESDWKAPIWARLPRIKRSIDVSDIREALENNFVDVGRWFGTLGQTIFQELRYFQSLSALGQAWEWYSHLEDATISPEIVTKPLIDWKWADQKWKSGPPGIKYDARSLLQTFSCIANLESGGVDIAPSKFTDVMAISSGDSIYVSSHLLCDPAEVVPSAVQRLVGNVGKPGLTLLVPPKSPLCLEPSAESWRVIDRETYIGQRDDYFGGTTLHLSFTEWSVPIDIGESGRGHRDAEAYIAESLVSVFDNGRWIADLDALSMLSKGSKEPDHEFFYRATCPHSEDREVVPTELETEIIVIKNWDEFLEAPQCPAVVLAHGNREARLALAVLGVRRGDRVFLANEKVCASCLEELEEIGGSELMRKALFLV